MLNLHRKSVFVIWLHCDKIKCDYWKWVRLTFKLFAWIISMETHNCRWPVNLKIKSMRKAGNSWNRKNCKWIFRWVNMNKRLEWLWIWRGGHLPWYSYYICIWWYCLRATKSFCQLAHQVLVFGPSPQWIRWWISAELMLNSCKRVFQRLRIQRHASKQQRSLP